MSSASLKPWRQVDYRPYVRFVVMRASLERAIPRSSAEVTVASASDEMAAVLDVDQSSFSDEWQYDEDCLLDALSATAINDLLVCRDNGGIAGYGVMGLAGPQGFLQRIAVKPAYRGSGIGTSLVRTGMQWARNRGARMVVLNTRMDNDPASRLYRREGFSVDADSLVVLRHDRNPGGL
ncbi:MAG: GNAT family N-acetyltransferase [Acidimicrobiia bacterium]|nr:GNAT family N-acetyltransferase [Acidimicrobiia bacterium]